MSDTVDKLKSGQKDKKRAGYRSQKYKQDAEALAHMRRMEIRLPVSHPIWRIPAGDRAAYVRALLDLGLLLDRQAEIEVRLTRLESGMSNEPAVPKETSIDIGVFTNAICDL